MIKSLHNQSIMNDAQRRADEVYSELLTELGDIQIQVNTAKPDNLKALLDRQRVIHEVIAKRLTELAIEKAIAPSDGLQSIVRPPYVVTFLLQAERDDYNITIHALSTYCTF